jgi:hypothetical protein
MTKTMDGKHASTLAVLSMCRHQRDKYAKKATTSLMGTLPEELQVLGRAILDHDTTNLEAAAYIDWSDALKAAKTWKRAPKRGKRRVKRA